MGVGRHEFQGALDDIRRRLDQLETWRGEHETEHDDDVDQANRERQERRRWTFTQIVAVAVATVTVGGFWLNALGK
jgi:hypothetical protein